MRSRPIDGSIRLGRPARRFRGEKEGTGKESGREVRCQETGGPIEDLEIQNALVAKGCLPAGAATGAWDQASADALKKFQSEQNIDSNGKINSLSLIALGLGPRHDSNSTKTAEGGNNYPPDPTGR